MEKQFSARVMSVLLSRQFREVAVWVAAMTLWLFGNAHMGKLGFGMKGFMDSLREHLLLCFAGAFFGWMLKEAVAGMVREYLFSSSAWPFPFPWSGFILLAVLFLVVLHQFRYFLNDGPANIAMGFGLLANHLYRQVRSLNKKMIEPPVSGKARFSGAKESETQLRLLYERNPFSPKLYAGVERFHVERGHRFKAALVALLAGTNGDNSDNS